MTNNNIVLKKGERFRLNEDGVYILIFNNTDLTKEINIEVKNDN